MKRVRSAMQVGEQSEKRTRIEPKRQLKSTTTVANVMRRNSEVKTPPQSLHESVEQSKREAPVCHPERPGAIREKAVDNAGSVAFRAQVY